jgi:tRNA threonylcarbamoyladenosine modification (KEOPS) complex  Pcc1 subunit
VLAFGTAGNVDTSSLAEHINQQQNSGKQAIEYALKISFPHPFLIVMNHSKTYPIYSMVLIEIQPDLTNIIINALKPESEMPSSERSHTILQIADEGILIIIKASDITALRAALNSYLRWIQGILSVVNKIQ